MNSLVRATLLLSLAACAGGDGLLDVSHRWPPDRPGYVSPVPGENDRPGDGQVDALPPLPSGELEGYADRVSARAGDPVRVHVSSRAAGTARWSLHRLGWYRGDRSREVLAGGTFQAGPQEPCPIEAGTNLLRCTWTPSFGFEVPADAVSGLHLLRIDRFDGVAAVVPLVVIDDRPADLVVKLSVASAQGFNDWGGVSFYPDPEAEVPVRRAFAVSFDRPYGSYAGGGDLLRYELPLLRFLERYDYDVTYVTDLDVDREGKDLLLKRGALLVAGRDSFWSPAERDAVEAARDEGLPLLFLGALTGYWQARFEDRDARGEARTVVSYRQHVARDPVQGPHATGRFRDPPASRPENALAGAMFGGDSILAHPWVVADGSDLLYEGTGLETGDVLPLLVGGGHDRTFGNGLAPDVRVVGRSPVLGRHGTADWAEATLGKAPSGALVFDAASVDFTRGLGTKGVRDPRIERMVANLIEAAIGVRGPSRLGRDELPAPAISAGPAASSVVTVARGLDEPAGIAALADGSLIVAEAGKNRLVRVGPAPARTVTAWIGGGAPGTADGLGTAAAFDAPTGLAVAADGTVFVADTGNHCLRRVDPAGRVSTLAGRCGSRGLADGAADEARFFQVQGVAVDEAAGVLWVADTGNDRIATVDLATGATGTVVVGRGADDGPVAGASVRDPTGLAVDGGRVFVVDTGNAAIRRIGAGRMTTVAGAGDGFRDGDVGLARLGPQGAAVWDGEGLVFPDPPSYRVRRLVPSEGRVHTLAGGRWGDVDGTGGSARLGLPVAATLGPDGTIWAVDGIGGVVRAIRR